MNAPIRRPSVLLYHRISARPLPAGTWVRPRTLAAQLDALQAAGWQALDADRWLEAGGSTASDFLITFDDGTDDLLWGRELLVSRSMPAVVFVPGDLLGRRNRWEWPLPGRRARHLDASALRDLADCGWEVGLHGATHRDLTRCRDQELEEELRGGRRRLEDRLGRTVRLLSYPYGRTDGRVAAAAQAAGFAAAFVVSAPALGIPERMAIPRRPIYCLDTARSVLIKLRDPQGQTAAGRWELWKERGAHGVGRTTALWRP
jgi:peptidoglycan/xylan/chitin deacetylase (PgdA/CDA1 family)